MSHKLITRDTSTLLEIRESDTSERIISGISVPFSTFTRIDSWEGHFEEQVLRGAFKKTIAERGDKVKLLAHHDSRSMPLGRAVLLEERSDGLYSEFKLSRTQAADEALELVRDGAITGLSVGMRVLGERWSVKQDRRTITEIALMEVSLCNFPAYETAGITGTRSITDISATSESLQRRLRVLKLGN
ncbi:MULTISPECIES: HK97 family phage prohead protease [Nocardiaceae]|uniref:HK97 family phage prohead protease n=1 Tax=Nocardiaceae TaxID=85025 RepID=UPI000AEA7726|nr:MULTISPECIES: HK97 family phage prohead protease [Rhodococcus]